MRIIEVTTWNFRNLPLGDRYYFGDHEKIVILGPNEAGKTSLFEAISLAFTLEETSTNSSILDPLTSYGSVSRPRVEVVFTMDRKKYRLLKDWDIRRGELETDGSLITRPQRIKEELEGILGVFNPTAFKFLLLVGQEELIPREGIEEKRALQNALERYLQGGRGGVDPNLILKELKKIVGISGKYVKESSKVYGRIEREKEETEREIGELEDSLTKFYKSLDERNKLELKVHEISSLLAENSILKEYLDLYIPYRESKEKMDFFQKNGPLLKNLQIEKERLGHDLEEIETKHKKFIDLEVQEERKKSLHKTLRELEALILKTEALEKKILSFEKMLKNKPVPESKELRAIEKNLSERRSLLENLEKHGSKVKINALKDIIIESHEGTRPLKKEEKWEIPLKTPHANFSLKDVLSFEVDLPFLKKSAVELEKVGRKLKDYKSKFGSLDPEELEERVENSTELKSLKGKKEVLLSGEKIEDIKDKITQIKKELDKIEEKLKDFPLKEMGELEGQKKLIKRQIMEKEKKIEKLKGALAKMCGGTDPDEIEKRLTKEKRESEEALLKVIAILSPEIKEKTHIFASMELDFLKERNKELMRENSRLLTEKANVERRLGSLEEILKKNPSEEALREKKEKLNILKEKLKLAETHRRALFMLLENLPKARADAVEFIQKEIQERLSRTFETLSRGNYKEVSLDFSSGKGWEITLTDRRGRKIPLGKGYDLSQGAKAQLFLALRLAFIDALSQDRNLPLFLDDTLSDFDPYRAKKALELLQKVSETRQVVLLTCHPEYSSFGHLVKIGGPLV